MMKFHDMAAELPLILDKIGADTSYPPKQETMSSIYGSTPPDLSNLAVAPHAAPSTDMPVKEYNVRNETLNCCSLVSTCGLAGCMTHTLTLEPEQAVIRFSNTCTSSTERKPYAQLGSVDEYICCCIHSINGMIPGCCGTPSTVKEIAEELQARKVGRGNIAQLRNQENTMIRAIETEPRPCLITLSRLIKKLAVLSRVGLIRDVPRTCAQTFSYTRKASSTLHHSKHCRPSTVLCQHCRQAAGTVRLCTRMLRSRWTRSTIPS